MQSERPRETFAALFARGWRIYAASFSASIAPSLLCFALPAALVSAVAYFAAVLTVWASMEIRRACITLSGVSRPTICPKKDKMIA